MTGGLLFDLDGTLVDTDHLHLAAFVEVFGEQGVAIDDHIYRKRIMGYPNAHIAAEFLPELSAEAAGAVIARKEALYCSRLGTLRPIRGVERILDLADEAGVPCAVVTNAPRANADLVLESLGLRHRFAAIVIGEEQAHSKPHPEPYLVGLRALGVVAANSLAFEDSRSGLHSAITAAIPTIGLMTSLEAAEILLLGAELAVRDYEDGRLMALVRGRLGALARA